MQLKEYFKFDNRFWRIILLLTSISAVFSQCIFLQGEMFFLLQFRERGNGNLICIMPGIFMRFEPVWLIGLLPGRDSCARDGFLKLPGLRFHDERNRDNRRGERGSRPGGVTLYPEAGRDALPRRWGVSHLLFFRIFLRYVCFF